MHSERPTGGNPRRPLHTPSRAVSDGGTYPCATPVTDSCASALTCSRVPPDLHKYPLPPVITAAAAPYTRARLGPRSWSRTHAHTCSRVQRLGAMVGEWGSEVFSVCGAARSGEQARPRWRAGSVGGDDALVEHGERRVVTTVGTAHVDPASCHGYQAQQSARRRWGSRTGRILCGYTGDPPLGSATAPAQRPERRHVSQRRTCRSQLQPHNDVPNVALTSTNICYRR